MNRYRYFIVFFLFIMIISIFLFFNNTKSVLYLNAKHRENIEKISQNAFYYNEDTYKITYDKNMEAFASSIVLKYYYNSGECEILHPDNSEFSPEVAQYVYSNGFNFEYISFALGIFSLICIIICICFKHL